MAKAVMPMRSFREKFGDLDGDAIATKLHELIAQFLAEVPVPDRKREPAAAKS
jgi:hypothetical protein